MIRSPLFISFMLMQQKYCTTDSSSDINNIYQDSWKSAYILHHQNLYQRTDWTVEDVFSIYHWTVTVRSYVPFEWSPLFSVNPVSFNLILNLCLLKQKNVNWMNLDHFKMQKTSNINVIIYTHMHLCMHIHIHTHIQICRHISLEMFLGNPSLNKKWKTSH